MAKTDAAKALEAKQKAAVKAEKERKRTSDNPKDWGTVRSIKEVYRLVRGQDPRFPALMAAAILGPFLLLLVLGLVLMATLDWAWWNVLLLAVLGLLVGIALAQFLLSRRAKTAVISRYEGQAGSGEIALQMLPKEWTHDPVIAFTRQQDVIHRALGPGGLFLIGEGQPGRVRHLLAQETKRHQTAMYGVKVKAVVLGDGEGMVSLRELTKYLAKQPKELDATKIAEASKRLRALDSVRNKMSLPGGPVPQGKGARRASRGR